MSETLTKFVVSMLFLLIAATGCSVSIGNRAPQASITVPMPTPIVQIQKQWHPHVGELVRIRVSGLRALVVAIREDDDTVVRYADSEGIIRTSEYLNWWELEPNQ